MKCVRQLRTLTGAFVSLLAYEACFGHVLENDALRIESASAEAGFGIVSIESKLGDGARFVYCDAMASSNFWALAFSRVGNDNSVRKVVIDNHVAAEVKRIEKNGDETRFVWQGIRLPDDDSGYVDVIASVVLPSGSNESEWRISVKNTSIKWALHDTSYPMLNKIVNPGEADALLPHVGLGARLLKKFDGKSRNLVCCWGEYPYPSYYPMMTAFMKDGQGLMVYADDPDARMKTLWINDLCVEFRTPIENAGVIGKAADGPGYGVKIGVFTGDWWQVAKRYRSWALKQKWTSKGPIKKRLDYPQNMHKPSAWFSRYQYGIDGFKRFFENIHREASDLNLGVRWYKWHSGDMDTNFPEFLPARDGVGDVGEALCKLGYVMMPYINARIWDTKLMSYDYAKKDLCLKEDGSYYTEKWSGKPYGRHDFGIMCPFASDWQKLVHRLAIDSISQTKCNAIYYDQVGCASPRGCCNLNHGHPLVGGRWWADGYRMIFERAHKEFAPRGIAMTTEGTAECYMDVCDGYLATSVPTAEDVPFWTAVYSGYTTYFAARFNITSRFSEPVDFEHTYPLMAREFIWGFVNCWSDDWRGIKGLDSRKCDSFLAFARARQELKEYLTFGFLEGALNFAGDVYAVPYVTWESMHSRKNPKVATMPSVIGSWWTDSDRIKRALIGVNVSKEKQKVRFHLPKGIKNLESVSLSNNSIPRMSQVKGEIVELTVDPYAIFCIEEKR